ncbi:MAG: HEAT repeat domain-containing protein [Phycisphaerales bacterium]|nr:MAG: HEAT repeat domain-containing protein [Phycisphaerales bacterium]
MIPLSTILRVVVVLLVVSSAALHSSDLCPAQRDNEEGNVLPLSTVYVPQPGHSRHKTFHTTVNWEGRQYGTSEGIRILMRVITDEGTHPDERAKALESLGTLWPWLRNTGHIPELIALYDTLTAREEKLGVMRCLIRSEEPRGLPLCMNVLDKEKDSFVRLAAAGCLAKWNVRRGVTELVARLDSDEVFPQPFYSPYGPNIGDNVLGNFLSRSRDRGWGFPEEEIRKSIEAQTGLDEAKMKALYVAEMKAAVKKWFAENEHRFPDWKPGDPLPAAQTLPPIPPIPGPEDVLALSAAFLEPPAYGKLGRGDRGYLRVGQRKEEEVSWEGERYPAAEAVDVLMKVVLEPGSVNGRSSALDRLERIAGQLRDTERVPQLVELYERLTGRSEKVHVLFCLARSKDHRALPLFAEILDTRREEFLRLPAAYGLALWNVRRGVRELIELLSVKQTESPILYPGIIGDEARRLLYRLNYWKSWWAPEAPLLAATGAGPEVRDELLDSCHAELKKWFAANQHRFPDWKLGDPLPKVPAPDADKSAGE